MSESVYSVRLSVHVPRKTEQNVKFAIPSNKKLDIIETGNLAPENVSISITNEADASAMNT